MVGLSKVEPLRWVELEGIGEEDTLTLRLLEPEALTLRREESVADAH